MRKFIVILLIGSTGLFCLQCSKSSEPSEVNQAEQPVPKRTPADLTATEKSVLNSSNGFGLKLFDEVVSLQEPGDNVFISPLSVSYALGMAYNGAAGETRDSIAATLELAGLSVEQVNESYRSLTALLTQLDPSVVFSIANSIWYQDSLPVVPAFIDLNQTYFNAAVREMNFSALWAADTINHWVDVNTNGKINEIVQAPIDPSFVLFLINAIYFKGDWTVSFDTALTVTAPFYPENGSESDCEFMLTDTIFGYLENDLFQAVSLPYGNEGFSMVVLLPRPSLTANDLIAEITDQNWAVWTGGFDEDTVLLYMPKFKFEYEIRLNQMLSAMGMRIAFDAGMGGADFSNMVVGGGIWIGEVKHKTFIQVDEVGTEAAAVTSIGFGIGIEPLSPIMNVNRPFLFVIHEQESGTILFMGKIAQPLWEE